MAAKKKGSEFPPLYLERVVQTCPCCRNFTWAGWKPADQWTEERIAENYRVGSRVNFKAWEIRDPNKLKAYWALLQGCVANGLENKYGRAEDLHNALKIALGYRKEIKMLNVGETSSLVMALGVVLNKIRLAVENSDSLIAKLLRPLVKQAFECAEKIAAASTDTIILPGSIALDQMDEGEFRIFKERAENELRRAGYPVDDLKQAYQEKLAA